MSARARARDAGQPRTVVRHAKLQVDVHHLVVNLVLQSLLPSLVRSTNLLRCLVRRRRAQLRRQLCFERLLGFHHHLRAGLVPVAKLCRLDRHLGPRKVAHCGREREGERLRQPTNGLTTRACAPLICDSTCVRTRGKIDSYNVCEIFTRPSGIICGREGGVRCGAAGMKGTRWPAHRNLSHLELVCVLRDLRRRGERLACLAIDVLDRHCKRTADTIGWSAETSTKRRCETSWMPFSARLLRTQRGG